MSPFGPDVLSLLQQGVARVFVRVYLLDGKTESLRSVWVAKSNHTVLPCMTRNLPTRLALGALSAGRY